METGERKRLEAETIIALAQALQVSADYLLGLTDNPCPRRRQKPDDPDKEDAA